jgi:F0F1-type ATP synthase delta subunit
LLIKTKREVLSKTLESQVNAENFLMILVKKDRINVLEAVIATYLELVYETASLK